MQAFIVLRDANGGEVRFPIVAGVETPGGWPMPSKAPTSPTTPPTTPATSPDPSSPEGRGWGRSAKYSQAFIDEAVSRVRRGERMMIVSRDMKVPRSTLESWWFSPDTNGTLYNDGSPDAARYGLRVTVGVGA